MSLPSAIIIAFAVMQVPAPVNAANDPVFQTSPCKPGYVWDDKKKKCVRKGLDY